MKFYSTDIGSQPSNCMLAIVYTDLSNWTVDHNVYYVTPERFDRSLFRKHSGGGTDFTLTQWQALGLDLESGVFSPVWALPRTAP